MGSQGCESMGFREESMVTIEGLYKWVAHQIQREDGFICLISQENLELILGNVREGVVYFFFVSDLE